MLKERLPPRTAAVSLIVAILIVLIVILVFSRRFFFVPKILMLLLILLAVSAIGRVRLFIQDWFIFIGFIYLFDSLRGAVYIAICRFGLPVHTLYVIRAEQFLFGGIPSVILQNLFLHPVSGQEFGGFEKFITVAYGTHFVAFILIGFIIWLHKPREFRFFKVSFYLVIFLGLLGYFAIPTVPPWMASSVFGLLPRLIRFNAIIFNVAIPDITSGFDTNPIAAMPSLHAAFPFLCALILWRIYRWKAWPFYIYACIVLFAIIYTGDHYFVDLLAGIILGVFCYSAGRFLTRRECETEGAALVDNAGSGAGSKKLVRTVVVSLLTMAIGIAIGSYNRNQFLSHPASYNLYMPRYIDFFRDNDEWRASYPVQYYLASHYFLKRDFNRSLEHFKKCLELSRSPEQRSRAEHAIARLNELLGKKD
jgi:membrane-associated phospholipid phosphatase